MRRSLLFAMWLAAALSARAQVEVGCALQHDAVCAYEPMLATVTIRNLTGSPLGFQGSEAPARFGFHVIDSRGNLLPVRTNEWFASPSHVAAQSAFMVTNNLALVYDLRTPGAYTVQAWVEWRGETFASAHQYVDVVAGVELAREQVSVDGPEAGFRQYSLLTLQRHRSHELLLRVDDQRAGICYGVYDLGGFLPMRPPELKVDALGQAHILHQASPSQFLYSVFDPNGHLVDRQEYGRKFEAVRMTAADGRVSVDASVASAGGSGADSPPLQPLPRMR